jgi:protein TonB
VALHLALVAVLVMQPGKDEVPPMPERMTVSLATDVSLSSTAPDPVAESRAAIAPTLSDEPQAAPIEQVQPEMIPAPKPVATTVPPRAAPTRAAAQPPRRRPDRPTARASSAPKAVAKPAGGSRIGADFLPGAGASDNSGETRMPASQIGASAKASLRQALARQISRRWQGRVPEGPDAELLVTILAFRLNQDGSLAGRPRLVSQDGINDLNKNQAGRHAEEAIKAVQLAAPFDLPPEYYEAWKRVDAWRFDKEL